MAFSSSKPSLYFPVVTDMTTSIASDIHSFATTQFDIYSSFHSTTSTTTTSTTTISCTTNQMYTLYFDNKRARHVKSLVMRASFS